MEQIKSLPIDMDTWRLLGYDLSYYVPTNPLDVVAQSAIKFYQNQLTQFDKYLTDENKNILKGSISRIEKLIK